MFAARTASAQSPDDDTGEPPPEEEPTPPEEAPPPPEPEPAEEDDEHVTMRATRSGVRAVNDSERRGEAPAYLLAAAYGGYVGGTVAYLVGEATESGEEPADSSAITLGVLLGGGAGIGTAAVFTARQDTTPNQVAAVGTGCSSAGSQHTRWPRRSFPRTQTGGRSGS